MPRKNRYINRGISQGKLRRLSRRYIKAPISDDGYGRRAESHVARVLAIAVESWIIIEVGCTEPFGPDDRRGVDVFFIDRMGDRYELQVKTSEERAVSFSEKRPHIPVVVVSSKSHRTMTKTAERLSELFPEVLEDLPKLVASRVSQ